MFWKHRVTQLVLKLLVATALITAAVVLFRWVLLPALASLLDLTPGTESNIRRPGVLCCVVLSYYVYVRFYEKRQANELRFMPAGITVGAISGAGVIGLASLFLFGIGAYEVISYRGFDSALLGVAGFILVAATIEEFVFRGVLFLALERTWGTVPALWLQSLFFSVLHIANLDNDAAMMTLLISVVSGTLIGAFWTLVFIQSRNLWVVSLNHAAWNFAVVLTGLPLSGLDDWRAIAPFESTYQGADWLTGGVVGPEDSVVTVVVVVVILIVMVQWAKKSQGFKSASTR